MRMELLALFAALSTGAQAIAQNGGTSAGTAAKWPPEAKEFQGHHYALYTDASKWDSAKFKCQQRGGHLAVVNNAAENSFVWEMAKDQHAVWIGLVRTMGAWRWVTVSQSEFFNWAPGEPNTATGRKNSRIDVGINACLYGNGLCSDGTRNTALQGRWSDEPGNCPDITGYVCEWEN